MKQLSFATALALAAFSTVAADKLPDPSKLPPASTKTGLTFQNDIKPIFDETCVRCHGAQKPRAGLRLDSLDGVMKGSPKDGPVVIAGQADKSPLVFSVASIDGKIFMPPKPRAPKPAADGSTNAPAAPPAHPWKPLTSEQVGVIRAWVDQGAK